MSINYSNFANWMVAADILLLTSIKQMTAANKHKAEGPPLKSIKQKGRR